MLHGVQLPRTCGGGITHTIWLKNCTSTKALGRPCHSRHSLGTKPDLSELHKWGGCFIVHGHYNASSAIEPTGQMGQDSMLRGKASCIYCLTKQWSSIKQMSSSTVTNTGLPNLSLSDQGPVKTRVGTGPHQPPGRQPEPTHQQVTPPLPKERSQGQAASSMSSASAL